MVFVKKCILKIRNKFREKGAFSVIDNLFMFLIVIMVLVMIMEGVQMMSIVKTSRDSLERATLSVATINEYKLYRNFRENMINDDSWSVFVTVPEVESVLADEFSLVKKGGDMYKLADNGSYYYRISDIKVEPVIDGNIYRINTTATLSVPIKIVNIGEIDFDLDVTCMYASKSNALDRDEAAI